MSFDRSDGGALWEGSRVSLRYLFLVILGDVAEELAGLPEQDVLLAELLLQELLRDHRGSPSITVLRPRTRPRYQSRRRTEK